MYSTQYFHRPSKLLASGLLLTCTALAIAPLTWAETVAGIEVRSLKPMVSAAPTSPAHHPRKDGTAPAPLTQSPQFTDISKILESAKSLPEPKPAPVKQPSPSTEPAALNIPTKPTTPASPLSQSPPKATSYLAHSASTSANAILPAPTKPYTVTVGKSELMTLPTRVIRVALSNPAVASVNIISPTQLQLVGHTPGVATLTLWHTRNSDAFSRVDVEVQRDVSALAYRLHAIDKRLTVEPIPAENSLILSGHVDTREEAQLALEIAKAYMDEQAASGSSGGSGVTAPSSNTASAGGSSGASTSSAGGSSSSSSGSSGGGSTPSVPLLSSFAPGSTFSSNAPNIINLIRVAGEPMTKSAMVREKLKALDEAIQMDVVPGSNGQEKVILTGSVRTAGQVSQAINLAGIFYGQPGLKVITGPGGNSVRDTGNIDFHKSDSFSDNMTTNILQGSIVSDASGSVVSMLIVRQRPQIRTRVKVLDVNRAALKQLGNNFLVNSGTISTGNFNGSQIPAPGKTVSTFDSEQSGSLLRSGPGAGNLLSGSITPVWGGGVTQFISLNNNLVMAISALTETRKGRSLAEPTLLSLSGEKASFLAGGEIPIPVLGTNGQISVEYHEFGIRLNLVATLKDDGTIHMQVAPEVSTVDPVNAVTTNQVSVPAFSARRFQTTVELRPQESLLMAGLFNQEEADASSRFPGIGNIPIIGSFFKGKYADHRDREMVVIIQPEVVYQEGL